MTDLHLYEFEPALKQTRNEMVAGRFDWKFFDSLKPGICVDKNWIKIALEYKDEELLTILLNKIDIPTEGLTLKQRIAYYYLICKE